MVPRINLEQYIITIFVLHDKTIVSSDILIYPQQGILHYEGSWYDFDMKKFKKIQTENPLRYHSQSFSFVDFLDYTFFRDSIQNLPNVLFLFEPRPKKFEGYFYVTAPRSSDSNSPIFAGSNVTVELKDQFPGEKFEVDNIINDSFNINNKQPEYENQDKMFKGTL